MTHQQAFEIALDHHRCGRLAEAESIYRQLLAIYPRNVDLVHLLGVASHHLGRREEGLRLIEQAIAANPGAAGYRNNYGLLLADMNRLEEALAQFREAIRLEPRGADGFYNMGLALEKTGRPAEAVEAYRAALAIQPALAVANLNLGNALGAAGRVEEAVAHFRALLERDPANLPVAVNLGGLLKSNARVEEAIAVYRQVRARVPETPELLSNLAVALADNGEIGEAVSLLRRSLALDPGHAAVRSNLVFTLNSDPAATPDDIAREQREWQARHGAPLKREWRAHSNDRTPGRRLRIGYVSPDLRDHVVGRTLLPCFEAHDRGQFEIVCYSDAGTPDAVSARFRDGSAVWRESGHLKDAALAEQIRADKIDILVDLALHTSFNRLLAFARKPAPVQVSWLGYPGGTGLEAMDYRITDPQLDPLVADEAGKFDAPLRMPDCWCCYGVPENSPEPGAMPALQAGWVTFGSFNNLSKINGDVLRLWARILLAVEGSRLLLVSKGAGTERIVRLLEQNGVARERVEFLRYYPPSSDKPGPQPPEYLNRYQRIDIALDPFPYNGMTTTCDALWMGVPVVALAGTAPMSRASLSLLTAVGLPELALPSEEEYLRTAAHLAADLPRLASLRASIRGRMKASPLLDARRFTRNLEAAFQKIWERWRAAGN